MKTSTHTSDYEMDVFLWKFILFRSVMGQRMEKGNTNRKTYNQQKHDRNSSSRDAGNSSGTLQQKQHKHFGTRARWLRLAIEIEGHSNDLLPCAPRTLYYCRAFTVPCPRAMFLGENTSDEKKHENDMY